MSNIQKITIEPSFSIASTEVSGANLNVVNNALSYYRTAASISRFDYSRDGTHWLACTTASYQPTENNWSNIPLKGQEKEVKLAWDIGTDLGAHTSYTNITVREEIAESGSDGSVTYYKSASISSIDLRPTSSLTMIRPYPVEPDFTISFKQPYCVVDVRCHFVIEVDTTESYDSANYQIHDSSKIQSGWTVSGSSFPSGGLITTSSLKLGDRLDVEFTTGSLSSLTDNTYYYRISSSYYPYTALDFEILHLKMDATGSGGTITDYSGLSNTATITGSLVEVSGKVDNALSGSSVTDNINIWRIQDDIISNDDWTVSTWVRLSPSVFDAFFIMIQWYDDDGTAYYIYPAYNGGDDMRITRTTSEPITTNYDHTHNEGITDSNWHHIVLIKKSNSNLEYYIDNTKYTHSSGVSLNLGAGSRTKIGIYTTEVDEYRIWNRALNPYEVYTLYDV